MAFNGPTENAEPDIRTNDSFPCNLIAEASSCDLQENVEKLVQDGIFLFL